ncbi:MAG: hypothetical protein JXB62_20490 [Pirellulales bacterium]|nr:hypothetical protein [Pirellulales bacterium]
MRTCSGVGAALAAWLLVGLWGAESALGNGGPFVVKYPGGDPAAKGVLARLDPSLKPARESRLRVVKEDLTITFGRDRIFSPAKLPEGQAMPPLGVVSAAYTIENPSDEDVSVDFGFPILRGIYMNPLAMMPVPDVHVSVDSNAAKAQIISNSVIYGVIRQRARAVIEEAIAADRELQRLVAAVREMAPPSPGPAQPQARQAAAKTSKRPPVLDHTRTREALRLYLVGTRKWTGQDAVLLVEYASLDFGQRKTYPFDRWDHGWMLRDDKTAGELLQANLGPLAAIGEQKATQFFAQLAGRFDPRVASSYESIFAAWGGDVRERSVDLGTGAVRPREIDVTESAHSDPRVRFFGVSPDPTIYARVEYLDSNAKISEAEKASCRAVLKNLPVVFTFAPMNLLHYQVSFPAKATRVVRIEYKQHAYRDTREPGSYQLAYVLHPATLWDDFGPIHLKVCLPEGVDCRASVPLEETGVVEKDHSDELITGLAGGYTMKVLQATLVQKQDKSGELLVGLSKAGWDTLTPSKPVETVTAAAPIRSAAAKRP